MNDAMNATMRETLRLMQTGDLLAATAEIQRRLGSSCAPPSPPERTAPRWTKAPIEGAFRVVDPPSLASARVGGERADEVVSHAGFSAHAYSGPAGSRSYKLYVPHAYRGQPLPLVVMLHGCTQTPDDFATGTRMNSAAEARGCLVVYPAQSAQANISKCWNWFQPGDQARDRGEPAIIAGLVREVMATHAVDPDRIYVAGMSAGGAMAVILGRTYPELFAAVGVHSGLPYRVAHDVPSALVAMQRRCAQKARRARDESASAPPQAVATIVFHGDRDTTVHPGNGDQVAAEAASAGPGLADASSPGTECRRGTTPHGRRYTCTIVRDSGERVVAEHWLVHGAGHAWSGGDPRGSFTDPDGPDATGEMMRFFLERTRR